MDTECKTSEECVLAPVVNWGTCIRYLVSNLNNLGTDAHLDGDVQQGQPLQIRLTGMRPPPPAMTAEKENNLFGATFYLDSDNDEDVVVLSDREQRLLQRDYEVEIERLAFKKWKLWLQAWEDEFRALIPWDLCFYTSGVG